MNGVDSQIKTSDGLDLYVWHAGQAQASRALVLLLHGIGEHCRRYDYVAEKMAERAICMVSYDRRGHGRSQGKRGVILSVDQLISDYEQMISLAASLDPAIPLFLYGHSLGALGVLYYALRKKPNVKGIIATSPPLDSSVITGLQKAATKILDPFLPNLSMSTGLSTKRLSRDKKVVEAYVRDPLVHDKASVRLGAYMMQAPIYIMEHAGEWQLPLYLAHGTEDKICPIAGSDNFAAKASGPITYKRWPGLYHEIHNEPEKDLVLDDMLNWIDLTLSRS